MSETQSKTNSTVITKQLLCINIAKKISTASYHVLLTVLYATQWSFNVDGL